MQLLSLHAPLLTYISGYIDLLNNNYMTQITFPVLSTLTSYLDISSAPVTSLVLPHLTWVGLSFNVQSCNSLTLVSAPSLTYVGWCGDVTPNT